MAEQTVSFEHKGDQPGWVCRWSYMPEGMTSLNSDFYTWNNGDLYKHNTNTVHNEFYGTQYPSSVRVVFNQDPTSVKSFKTISQDSTAPWNVTTETDLSVGAILEEYFKKKEGEWFAFIRRTSGISEESLSTQGVGSLSSIAANVLTFGFNLSAPVSSGDLLYILNGNVFDLIGTVESHDATTITITSPLTNTPTPGQFIVLVKDSIAESYHQRGTYMITEMTITSDDVVELFSIASEADLSSPS